MGEMIRHDGLSDREPFWLVPLVTATSTVLQ